VIDFANESEVVPARRRCIQANGSPAAAQTAAVHAGIVSVIGLSFAGLLNAWPHANHLAHAQKQGGVGRSGSKIERHNSFAFAGWVGIEAAVLRLDDAGCAADSIGGPRIELIIARQIVADGQVVRNAGSREELRCEHDSVRRSVTIHEHEVMTVTEYRASIIK